MRNKKYGTYKKDYKVKGLLKDGKISLLNDYNFENINFLLNIENDNFNFRKIKFTTNNIDFFSDSLKIKKYKPFLNIDESKCKQILKEIVL